MALTAKTQKRPWPVLILAALLLFLFCACGQVGGETVAVYDVTQNGVVYTVDREACTITTGDRVYRYEMDGDRLTITYPNGAIYSRLFFDSGSASGWNDIYDESHDIPGETLMDVLDREAPVQRSPEPTINPAVRSLGLLFAALGLWGLISPKSVWYFNFGWRYKNAEPSDLALLVNQIAGVLLILIGLSLLFIRIA